MAGKKHRFGEVAEEYSKPDASHVLAETKLLVGMNYPLWCDAGMDSAPAADDAARRGMHSASNEPERVKVG
jgi:hypothetical protein